MKPLRASLGLLLATVSAPSFGQESCFAIGNPIERLECYDIWATEQAGEPIGTVAVKAAIAEKADIANTDKADEPAAVGASEKPDDPPPPETAWTVNQRKSAMVDTTDVFVTTYSEAPVMCAQYGNSGTLSVILRCMENTTSVIIAGDCHMASGFHGYGEVTYRLDDNKARSRNFDASTDSRALGLWNGGSAIPFIKDMFGKETLLVRFTPFGMSPVDAEFDISGTEDAVKDLRTSCNW